MYVCLCVLQACCIGRMCIHSYLQGILSLQCRERASSYKAKLAATFSWLVDGRHAGTVTSNIGQVPIMVKVCMK